MAIVQSNVGNKEGFLVQMGGDYNLPFDELELSGTQESGDVIAVGDGYGIVAGPGDDGDFVRVMVRGNPTTVNAQALNYGELTVSTVNAALEDQGIVVVNG